MKIIKILAFVLFIQGIAASVFAAGVTSPTAQDYLANAAYCNNPSNNCTAAQIGTGDGGVSVWVTGGATNGNGNGILCANGFVWSSALGSCVASSTQQNPCTYMSGNNSVTQPHGATWSCACSGSTVNLATCTCNNGTVTRSETGCEKFTKYQVCPSNQCKTQSGSCYKGAPDNCVWESCASATGTSLPSGADLNSSVVNKTLP